MIANSGDYDVRTKNIDELKDAMTFNPAVIVINCAEQKLKEAAMVTKLPAPALIVAQRFIDELILRGDSYDFVTEPVDEKELALRVKNLLKIKELKETIDTVSTTDALTGLHNRKYLHERLEAEISRAKRYDIKLSCLLLDIDFFKHVNDEHGHGMGDYVLKSLSYILKSSMEGRGQVARWGGEEFLLTFENTELDRAYKLLDQIRARIAEQEFTFKDVSLHLTITGGIEEYSMTESIDAIITRADEKLYRGKTSGRNQIVA
mgnify:CR=1 FL=1